MVFLLIIKFYQFILQEQLMKVETKDKGKESKQNRYEKIKKLGEGAYGSVTKVFDHETQTIRALKKIKFTAEDDGIPINAIRQIAILKRLSHPNIIKIYDVHYHWDPCKLYISLEYVQQNLYEHLKRNQPLSPYSIKSIAFEALSALNYLHSQGIMHRDIKPHNLMITANGNLKLCDFGQSKCVTINKQTYSIDVSTLWYRAPQILLGSQSYGFACDIWGIGCVLAEMIQGTPIFKSDCEIGQIFEIFKLTGTPKRQEFPNWPFLSNQFPSFPKTELKINYYDKSALDLIEKLLELDPNKRISSYQALKHEYFQGY